jgi:hypothetical protein
VAVGAEETKVARAVVEEIPVDVIDMKRQRPVVPGSSASPLLTVFRKADAEQCDPQSLARYPSGTLRESCKTFPRWHVPNPAITPIVGGTLEMRRVDAEPLHLPG